MIKSENKEYLLEFSKIDIAQTLDLYDEKNRLIELKKKYDIYKESELFLKSFKRRTYSIDMYMNSKYRFIISPKKGIEEDMQYCFSLKYKLSKENLLYHFLTETISLEYFLETIEKLILEKFIQIKLNLIRDLIIKDALYWSEHFDKYPFLIYIVNIEDFYNLIGRYEFFDHIREYNSVQYSRGVELIHSRIGYTRDTTGSITAFIKERSENKDLYAKLIYNQYQNNEFTDVSYYKISSFLIYAIYNELILDETVNNVLRMKSDYLFKFIIEIFYSNTEILNKLIKYIPKDDPIIYYTNMKSIYTYNCIPQLIYKIEIEKGYFRENSVDVLLGISKLLMQGNKIRISNKSERYYMHKFIIRDYLVENIDVLAKILNITSDELADSIGNNLS